MARRSIGASDRIVLDVGGTKFITSSSTLTSNSSYFASLLSDNWIEQSNNGDDEIFIDQDAVPFKVLLAYMRRGNIKVEDISTNVLSLAEFLGMERLLLAIKVRWYCNIGRGPVVTTDDEIAMAFDEEHGGIMKAISSGLFPHFSKQNDIGAEKEFAVFYANWEIDGDKIHALKEIGNPENPGEHRVYGAIGALNGLYLKGYTDYESQLKTSEERYTFSRRKHATIGSGATDIFILNENETVSQARKGYVKQFAAVINPEEDRPFIILAPSDFHKDESKKSNPLQGAIIIDRGSWLEDNGFGIREYAYEDIFREFYSTHYQTKFNVFSRVVRKDVDVTW